jgi:alanine-glyoxylate transaminase / serine-glyoxylate transaminase / serine-pyruvate transaminase
MNLDAIKSLFPEVPEVYEFKILGTKAPMVHTGRHFLQIPGPTNVPDRVLRAMDMPTIDHRGPEFAQLGLDVLED